ncbi:MAG: helix-turn-helix domain-containing protein [Cryobacterium sp.]|nr:helix-turn-helix domain-containing protein [Cryobacterium sp.]
MGRRLPIGLGLEIRDERVRRGWSQVRLAHVAGVSPSMVHGVEAGDAATLDGYARLADVLGLEPRFSVYPAARPSATRTSDVVHSALGEMEAARFRGYALEVRLDEPYQHYQFAGRADLTAVDRERHALLHIENRTRFPDIQAFLGSYSAKRAYLHGELAARLGLRGFASVTHAVVALWSSEVLHVLRMRHETFRATCPDATDAFAAWWDGQPPNHSTTIQDTTSQGTTSQGTTNQGTTSPGTTSTLVVLDPTASGRQRAWIDLERALIVRPRHRGYADAAKALAARDT